MTAISIFSVLLTMVALIVGTVGGNGEPAEYTPMVAAGYAHIVGLKNGGTAISAGLELELAQWDLS